MENVELFLNRRFFILACSIVGCRTNCGLCSHVGVMKLSKLNSLSARSDCNKKKYIHTLPSPKKMFPVLTTMPLSCMGLVGVSIGTIICASKR